MMRRHTVIRHPAALLSLLPLLGTPSCEEYGPRIYTAHPYQEGAACLAPSVPIGVVTAAELPASCEPVCLLLDQALYVSRVCRPLPARAVEAAPGTGPACALATALLTSGALCAAPPLGSDAGFSGASPLDAALPAAR